MKFENTLQNKLLTFSIAAVFFTSIAVIVFLWKNKSIDGITTKIVNERVPTSIHILKLQSALEKSSIDILNYSSNTNQESFHHLNKTWAEEINPTIEKIKLQLQKQADEKINSQLNSLLITTATIYFTQQEIINILSTSTKKTDSNIELLYRSKLKPQLVSINTIVQDIIIFEKNKIDSDASLAKKYSRQINWIVSLFLIAGISLFTVFPYFLLKEVSIPMERIREFIHSISIGNIPLKLKPTNDEWSTIIMASNKLAENLENVKTFASEVGNGNFETNINVFNNEGELGGSLAEMRESLIKVAEEDKKRNWGTNGLAQMGEILRNNTINPEELYLNITCFLVKYMNANQGGMFLINSENKEDIHLELVACYAFNRKKFIQKRIEMGEGLVAQAILEKDVIYMTEIPDNYISITSGLGAANPRCIIIVPLKINSEIHGAIELASFHTFDSHKIEFLKKVAESIASTISNVKINEQTKNLLDSSQQMTEQLRSQEEEMRQNVEELQATQEEMYRKQIEMDGQMSAINGIYLFIEFDINGYITNANELFLKTMKYTLEEIRGKSHQLIISPNSSEAMSHESFWQNLREGSSQSGEFKRITKEGAEVWLIANYTPVFDKSGELIKVITLASDITKNKNNTLELTKQIETIEYSYAIAEYDINGCITKINPLFSSLTGYTENELQGRHHSILINQETKTTAEYKDFWKNILNGLRQNGEFKRLNKKGDLISVHGSYNPVSDLNGIITKVICYFTQITNQTEPEKTITEPDKELAIQEEELRKNLEELKSLQEEMQKKSKELSGQLDAINNTIPLAEFSSDGILLDANELFLKTLNYSLKEIKGKNYNTLYVTKNSGNTSEYSKLWENLKGGKTKSGIYTIIDKNNKEIPMYVLFTPVLNTDGVPVKAICLFLESIASQRDEEIKKLKETYESRIKELESKLK